jgi:DNA modification methylase
MNYPPLWTPETIIQWVDERLEESRTLYAAGEVPQPVAFRELCSQWQWAKRSDVYTHLLHRYPAKLLSYIPIFFLSSSLATLDDRILDPFAGTGTVLLESISHPYFPRNCYGVEISPLARLIAKVKTTPINPDVLEVKSEQLYHLIREYDIKPDIPDFPNRDYWFRSEVLEEIAKVRACINNLESGEDEKDFFLVCLSSIIRDVSWADTKIAPPVKLRADKFPEEQRLFIEKILAKKSSANVFVYFQQAVARNTSRMRRLYEYWIKRQQIRAEIIWDDARSIAKGSYAGKGIVIKTAPESLDGQIGLVITSPPYINAQKYVRTTKLELWCLGLETRDSIQGLDEAIIGSERIYYEDYKELRAFGNPLADQLLGAIYDKSPRQAGIVSRYFRDMRIAIQAIHRVLKAGGYFVMVVGDNRICSQTVESHKILADIAKENNDFSIESVMVDTIRSRGLITKRHETAGVIPEEWVLVMRKHSIESQ